MRRVLEVPTLPPGTSISVKVDQLEKDMKQIGVKAVELKKVLGTDFDVETPENSEHNQTTHWKREPKKLRNDKNEKQEGKGDSKGKGKGEDFEEDADDEPEVLDVDSSLLEEPKNSLKGRIRILEMKIPPFEQKTSVLEEEFHGAVNDPLQVNQPFKLSLKSKVEALLAKVENFKQRFIALDPTPILSHISAMEDKASAHKLKLSNIASATGLDGIRHNFSTLRKVKPRLTSLEKFVEVAHGSASVLEQELLGEASSPALRPLRPSLVDRMNTGQRASKGMCVKNRLESLNLSLESLATRLASLEAPSSTSLESLENKMANLRDKCLTLAGKIGLKANIEEFSAKKSVTLRERVLSLIKYLTHLDSHVAPLEEELIGTPTKVGIDVNKAQTIKQKIDALKAFSIELETRLKTLQSEA